MIELCGEARTWEAQAALRLGGNGHKALECGAWPLYLSRAIKERYEHVTATDSFEWWDKRPEAMKGDPSPGEWQERMGYGVETRQADARRLPWGDKHFDAVYAVSVIEHITEDLAALQEWLRVGRRVIVTTDIAPERVGYFNYARVHDPDTLRTLLHRATGQTVQIGEFPAKGEWMYPGFTCCGFKVEA